MTSKPFDKSLPKAFSLVEISIVILIIGILIAGIAKGVDLYRDFKLASARNLTQNSIVPRISNLEFWADTYSINSFDTTLKNNDLISKWNNINQISLVKLFADSPSSQRYPKYIENGINNLPSIEFDGVDDCLRVPFNLSYIANRAVSIFIVFKTLSRSSHVHSAIFGNDSGGWGRAVLATYNNGTGGVQKGNGLTPVSNIDKIRTNFIMTYISVHNVVNASSLRLNQNYSSVIATDNFSTTNHSNFGIATVDGHNCARTDVGKTNIQVSEIIVYSRNLNIKEIKLIEDYLSKKYSISLLN